MCGGLLCITILGAAGVCIWRFGPWSDNNHGNRAGAPMFSALNACDGCCNRIESNCDLPMNKVLFFMVHNATC